MYYNSTKEAHRLPQPPFTKPPFVNSRQPIVSDRSERVREEPQALYAVYVHKSFVKLHVIKYIYYLYILLNYML